MSQAADTVGQRLKAERERRGIHAEKAADELHFDISIIEALEAGDFARLGPAVYGKGHLKRYAEFLGLPAAEMLEVFASRPSDPATGAAAVLHMPADPSESGDPQWVPAAGVVAAAVVVAAVLWWKPWHAASVEVPSSPGGPQSPAAGAVMADPPPPPLEADAERDGAPATEAAAAPATPVAPAAPRKGDTEPTAALGRAKLRLSFSADSWVDVHDATGARVFAGRGRANSVKTIAGAAPMRVYIGFASGVQLEVNNHAVAIGPQFLAGDVARFEAGADGVLRRDAHAHDVAARNPQPRT